MSDTSGGGRALEDEAERKRKRREICQASRKRIQVDKNAFGSHIAALRAKIAAKKKISESLEQKRNMSSLMQVELMNKRVQLQQRIAELKKQQNGQNKELEALSKRPLLAQNVGFDSHVVGWRNEVIVRRQTDWNEWASEKAKLDKEIDELRMKKANLNMKMQVLKEKIIHMRIFNDAEE